MAKSPSRHNNTIPKTDGAARPPRSAARFKERELARAVRAAKRAGGVERVEIAPDGQINLILGHAPKAATANEAFNEWDEALGR
jgi:hypothetical protein